MTDDDVIAELARVLRGPARARRRLLAEARDGLTDAVDRYLEAGLPRDEATRRAAAEFGTPAELVPAFQAELDVRGRRRAALATVLALPPLAWLINLAWDTDPRTADVPAWIAAIGLALAVTTVAFGLSAAVVVWSTGRPSPGRSTRYGTRAMRLGGLGSIAVLVSGMAAMAVTVPSLVLWPPFLVTSLVAAALFALSARAAAHA